jgi:hypothetical protein
LEGTGGHGYLVLIAANLVLVITAVVGVMAALASALAFGVGARTLSGPDLQVHERAG